MMWSCGLVGQREGPVKIGVKEIGRAWKNRAKNARHVVTDSERPGLALITNATSQTWPVTSTPDPAPAWASDTVSAIVSACRSQAATEQPSAAS